MPELPEVRTVAKALKQTLLNKKITAIKIIYPRIIEKESLNLDNLIGQKLLDIETTGKYLLFCFDEFTLISHLRMEGKYFIKKERDSLAKHEHIIFNFDEISLRYHDTRKFGRMCLIEKDKLSENKSLKKLAKEPFELDAEDLYKKLKNKNKPIKSLLLDQTIINGLGNIYANEVLFACNINPFKTGKELSKQDAENIIENSIKILNKSIASGGTTIRSYTSSLGVTGHYQDYLCVHTKENEPCLVCKTKISKDFINGRSTYFCPNCQK